MINTVVGILVSLIYSMLFLPKEEGGNPYLDPTYYPFLHRGMIIVPYNTKKALHIHHWMVFAVVCIIHLCIPLSPVLFGFSLGMMVHGLSYKDCFNIICKNPYLYR